MNMRIVALGLVFSVSLVLAQESPKPAKVKIAERSAMLQTLQRGKQITVGREQYQHLPEVFAAERNGNQTQQHALDAVGAGAAQVIETKGRLVLYRGNSAGSALVARVGASNVYPTVVNVRTGTLGVLTGTLVVKPKRFNDAASIASQYGLETVKEFAHIGTVFYRAKANADIADLAAALQADARVENAYPEIIERLRRPK
jgi:uncharacterized protein